MKTYIIAEVGQNHNGSIVAASDLIRAAASAGANAVKFQKRTVPDCIPIEQRSEMRDTPWGAMSYVEYRHQLEFSWSELDALRVYASALGLDCFVSVWDVQAARELTAGDWCAVKIPSAKLTDTDLLRELVAKDLPQYYLSTGMSTEEEIDTAIYALRAVRGRLTVFHCHSGYPAPEEELNLRCIPALRDLWSKRGYMLRMGYSGHELGTLPTTIAVALGAEVVERHLTLDHSMWGSDHSASLEPWQFGKMVEQIRQAETVLGTGEKSIWESEQKKRQSLRGPVNESTSVAV